MVRQFVANILNLGEKHEIQVHLMRALEGLVMLEVPVTFPM